MHDQKRKMIKFLNYNGKKHNITKYRKHFLRKILFQLWTLQPINHQRTRFTGLIIYLTVSYQMHIIFDLKWLPNEKFSCPNKIIQINQTLLLLSKELLMNQENRFWIESQRKKCTWISNWTGYTSHWEFENQYEESFPKNLIVM